ncbi:hypothetical protein Lalb_Chr05g0214311 [Lupinus albus]|uniref:RING-type E3 ubiquitin transferase n=1 Tax=Lupinus albus TaxID=3870 RepID=A0A6A4QGV9_LUPAL|nr:hypothetical protein Lalb_Chr05g0214311 [Lupinus albus]
MGAFIFFILFLGFTFHISIIKVNCANYQATQLCGTGPDIHYPFQIKGQQTQFETLPDFEILCKDNITTIHFPSYGDLVVKSISYDTKKIDLLDPRNCSQGVFLNLDLSHTPFQYYYFLKNFSYLNCSTNLSPRFIEVPCLSGSTYHVYTVDPALFVPSSCKIVKTVAIPFEYSPYISDNKLGLRLTWDMPESEDRKALNQTRDSHKTRYIVLGFSICVFLVATLISKKNHGSTRNSHHKEGQLLQSMGEF